MAEKIQEYSGKVKQKGIFHLKKFYNFAYEQLKYQGYDVHEKQYLVEMETQGRKVEIAWVAKKKVSDYFQFEIKIDWIILRMNDMEVMQEGEKIKMQKGEPELKVKGNVIKDYESKWDTPFLEFVRRIYDDYIIRSRVDEYKDKIIDDSEEFIRKCKEYLTIEGYPESHRDYA